MYEILTTFVLMWSWFIVWLFVVFNQIYSYDVLYILRQCAIRINESENTYVCMYVCMYICIYVLCMYVSTYTCLYIRMGIFDIEQIPPNVLCINYFFVLWKMVQVQHKSSSGQCSPIMSWPAMFCPPHFKN
jgi:hypothetical protein